MTVNRTNDPDASAGGQLGLRIVEDMNAITFERMADRVRANAEGNADWRRYGKSLAALRKERIADDDSAIVIAAGPSIHRFDPIKAIKESGYRGAVVATESAVFYCLRNGVVPDLVVTVDPQEEVIRWLGDPTLDQAQIDAFDYFKRQDMDEAFRADEMKTNQELISLLREHGKDIRLAIATSSSPRLAERAYDTGMTLYWWNPMMDDPNDPQGFTAELQRTNKLPCVNAGGNVGAACWMMAQAVLGKSHVALTGMDFGYYDGTPYERTQYYYAIRDLVGDEEMESVFMRLYNPHLETWFMTDPAYRWYREIFLEMASDARCKTYNCTQGGILFGDPIEFIPLSEFLKMRQDALGGEG